MLRVDTVCQGYMQHASGWFGSYFVCRPEAEGRQFDPALTASSGLVFDALTGANADRALSCRNRRVTMTARA